MTNRTRVVLFVAMVAAAVALFVVLNGSDDDSSTTTATTAEQPPQPGVPQQPAQPQPRIQTISVRDGAPVGGVQRIEVRGGEQIHFRVVADEPGEIHIHGYQTEDPVRPGRPALIRMAAELEGGYEVELHGERSGDVQIAELRVSPG